MSDHPVKVLRGILESDFRVDLPYSVSPVMEYCREPQFFPGASGLLDAATWADVKPAVHTPASDSFLPAHHRGVMVVGSYQATKDTYERLLRDEISGLQATWGKFGRLLRHVSPSEVFLTNAFVGLPDRRSDRDPFPTTPEYTSRCAQLLSRQIELFNPRAVVCMGRVPAEMLAGFVPQLGSWRPWPTFAGFSEIDRAVPGCHVGEGDAFTAVVVHHPSFVMGNDARDAEAGLINRAANG